MENTLLVVDDLHVSVESKEILKGLTLELKAGEIHALMGPNGSGKSTLSFCLMGHPHYQITQGRILLKGQDISQLSPNERAKAGLFLAFQYPTAIPGVTIANFLRTSLKSVRGQEVPVREFRQLVKAQLQALGVPDSFMNRYVNDGFSGGEKKRLEILQLAVLQPQVAILDETDSGLDIDALKVVSEGINRLRTADRAMLLITHYQRILNYIKPDHVHVMVEGRVVESGGPDLALQLERQGDAGFRTPDAHAAAKES